MFRHIISLFLTMFFVEASDVPNDLSDDKIPSKIDPLESSESKANKDSFSKKKEALRPPPIRSIRSFNLIEEVDDDCPLRAMYAFANSLDRYQIIAGVAFSFYVVYLINFSELAKKT